MKDYERMIQEETRKKQEIENTNFQLGQQNEEN